MATDKKLRLWNGRGHGKHEQKRMNVAAYSRKQASELLSRACGVKVTETEIKFYFSELWGNDMVSIIPIAPCVYVTEKTGKPNPIVVIATNDEGDIVEVGQDNFKPFISREEGAKLRQEKRNEFPTGEWSLVSHLQKPNDLFIHIGGPTGGAIIEFKKGWDDMTPQEQESAKRIIKGVNVLSKIESLLMEFSTSDESNLHPDSIQYCQRLKKLVQ